MIVDFINAVGKDNFAMFLLLFGMFGLPSLAAGAWAFVADRQRRKEKESQHRFKQEDAEQKHRQRMELLQQLEKIAALEGLAQHEKNSEYAKLRDSLLAELDANLEVAATADETLVPRKRARRSRSGS